MSGAGSTAGAPSPGDGGGSDATSGYDRALSVTVPAAVAEQVGAIFMEAFGPFEEIRDPGPGGQAQHVTLVFYPEGAAVGEGAADAQEGGAMPDAAGVLSLLPPSLREPGVVRVEVSKVPRDWVDGWKAHFRPILIGSVRIRPPWEPAREDPPAGLVEVVINPGLGFGTGLHPTTRGTLRLLQETAPTDAGSRRLLDAGTGSGVLAIAAALLGWAPIVALDNDPVALMAARENVGENGVAALVDLREAGVEQTVVEWFSGATVLANMTLEPVLILLDRLAAAGPAGRPQRLVVSGILAGAQEQELLRAALAVGFVPGQRVYEAEWVSLELLPSGPGSDCGGSCATVRARPRTDQASKE